jgi:hypothetical protein
VTNPSDRKEGFSLLDIGAVACIACCAGPILGVLGGLSLAGVASTAIIGATGLVVAVAAGGAWLWVSRKRRAAERISIPARPVEVGPPTRRP